MGDSNAKCLQKGLFEVDDSNSWLCVSLSIMFTNYKLEWFRWIKRNPIFSLVTSIGLFWYLFCNDNLGPTFSLRTFEEAYVENYGGSF